jgi:hypothetical protein
MAAGEDRPIVVGGASQMITIQLPPSFKNTAKGKFEVAPKDSATPFKSIVVMKGGTKEFEMSLDVEWTITIE